MVEGRGVTRHGDEISRVRTIYLSQLIDKRASARLMKDNGICYKACLCLAVKTQVKRKPCTMRCDLMQMRESAGCVVRFTKVLLLTIDPGIADILGVNVPRKLFTNADWFSVNKYHSV